MTVIDKIVDKFVRTYECGPQGKKASKGLSYIEKCRNAIFAATTSMFSEDPERELSLGQLSQRDFRKVGHLRGILSLINPFVIREGAVVDEIKPQAIMACKHLVRDLSGAVLPENLPSNYFLEHPGSSFWFVEIPYGEFEYSSGVFLRGVFYYSHSRAGLGDAPSFVSLVCERNSGYKRSLCYLLWDYRSPASEGEGSNFVALGDVDYSAEAVARAKLLAQMIILHHDSKVSQGAQFKSTSTYPEPCGDKRGEKKRGKSSPKYSVLRMVDLRYDGEYSSGRKRPETSGRSLDHPVKVRGHFRWQAWGPRWSKRRLVWLDSYTKCAERGEDTRAEAVVL